MENKGGGYIEAEAKEHHFDHEEILDQEEGTTIPTAAALRRVERRKMKRFR
jgi:hypothetical protein